MVILAFQFDWNVHRFIGHLLSFFRCIWNFICAYMCITHSIDMLKMYTFAKRNIHANERMQIFENEHTFDTQIMLINSHCYWFECNHHGGVLCVQSHSHILWKSLKFQRLGGFYFTYSTYFNRCMHKIDIFYIRCNSFSFIFHGAFLLCKVRASFHKILSKMTKCFLLKLMFYFASALKYAADLKYFKSI